VAIAIGGASMIRMNIDDTDENNKPINTKYFDGDISICSPDLSNLKHYSTIQFI